jgi:hypothetical protein
LDFLEKTDCGTWIIAGFIEVLNAQSVCFKYLDGGNLGICETFCAMMCRDVRDLVRDDGSQFRLAVCGSNDPNVGP